MTWKGVYDLVFQGWYDHAAIIVYGITSTKMSDSDFKIVEKLVELLRDEPGTESLERALRHYFTTYAPSRLADFSQIRP